MARDPYKYFRVEAGEILEQLNKGALDLEKGSSDPDLVARLLRLAHTLKGAARVVRQPEIADQAHTVEDILEPYRESVAPLFRDRMEALLGVIDAIGRRVAALTQVPDSEEESERRLQPDNFIRATFDHAEMDELLDGTAEVHAQTGLLRKGLATSAQARNLVDVLLTNLAPSSRKSAEGETNSKAVSVAEDIRELLASLDRGLIQGLGQIDRELRQVRDTAERLKLAPVGILFTSLERAARDIARTQGKQVLFEGKGAALRLDIHLLGTIQNALLQLVRNAVAHGIESPKVRQAAGKSAEGSVGIEAIQSGRRVVFRCRDDGAGIDIEAVRRIVKRKGLTIAQTENLGTHELVQLLMQGGISTSHTVTEVSGRGVGLDVVREIVERLGGEMSFQTEEGRGVSVDIDVPVSVSSVEALIVEGSGTVAAIPLHAVKSCVRVQPDGFTRTPTAQTVLFNSEPVPFCPLATILFATPITGVDTRAWSTVILAGKTGMIAVGVDRLMGTANVVVRPLPELAPVSPVTAGLSLNANGNPQLVLDPDGLVEEVQHKPATRFDAETHRCPVLVIDDSLTTRMLEQSILESAGYEVDVASSGEEGLEKARRRRYGLFLVDIEMPGIDGFTFIERTRADLTLKDVPSILVTSRESSDDRRRGEEVGARGYVVKGEFNQEKLLELIRELVG